MTILLAYWVFKVVPSGKLHRSPDLYPRDMCIRATSVETMDSELSQHLDTGLCAYLAVVCQHSLLPPQSTMARPRLDRVTA